MCGIAGLWCLRQKDPDAVVAAMTNALEHRGPDASGFWSDEVKGVYLGHRRLAIVDLSEHGAQPMSSVSGRYVLVYNGEIYNHRELRSLVEQKAHGWTWRGHSDTETLLAVIQEFGLLQALQIVNGMFAIALWDREDGSLTLARDKIGEKPLYYASDGLRIVFGSELRALRACKALSLEISPDAIARLLANAYVSAPQSIYRGVSKLEAGCTITFKSADAQDAVQRRYWELSQTNAPLSVTEAGDDEAAWQSALADRLEAAVSSRMMSDVPLGAFLSGGVDSSLVVALMQKNSMRPVKTFTIGMEESSHNEANFAKAVAQQLGTDHTEFYLTDKDVLDVVPRLAAIWDEPFADSSQIPTYLVSALTRQHVTVALSGDGGDELFAGYSRYSKANELWSDISRYPAWLRVLGAGATEMAMRNLPDSLRISSLKRAYELSPLVGSRTDEQLYHMLQRHWKRPEDVVSGCRHLGSPPMLAAERFPDFTQRMMHLDTCHYLPDDILTKVDRASMAVSLESRAPLLDIDLVEFAWHSPMPLKVRDGIGKMPLKQELAKHIPQSLIDRPKMGFGVAIGDWLRGPLKSWAEDLLAPETLKRQGFLNADAVQMVWGQHQRREWTWEYLLWDVLMFQAWIAEHHE